MSLFPANSDRFSSLNALHFGIKGKVPKEILESRKRNDPYQPIQKTDSFVPSSSCIQVKNSNSRSSIVEQAEQEKIEKKRAKNARKKEQAAANQQKTTEENFDKAYLQAKRTLASTSAGPQQKEAAQSLVNFYETQL